jgi:hypothetical protein
MLQGVVKQLNMTLFSGQEWVFHPGLSSCPKGQDKSGVAAEEPSSVARIDFREVQTSNFWTINCGLFSRTWCAESITTAWRD